VIFYMKTRIKHILTASVIGVFLLMFMPGAAIAAPSYGFGAGHGRTQPINENDFHTADWDRFGFNYEFTSGADRRYDLGRPTTFSGNVPADIFSANIRRDRHVASVPPSYGVFSGHIPTFPQNDFFPQPVHPAFWQSFEQENPHSLPAFDTLRMGANAPALDNPMNMHNVGQQAILPNTSISDGNMPPAGLTQGVFGEQTLFLPPTSLASP
jgi:hypothetical protein